MGSNAFWGDLPTWITTIAVVLAVIQFLADRQRRQEEQDRERREQARRLTTWVATTPGDERCYGVVLRNSSGSTFHDLRVDVVMHDRAVVPIDMQIVPPGEYFVEHEPPEAGRRIWDFAKSVHEVDGDLRPYMQTQKYRVTAVTFTDNAGVRWATDDRARLTEAK